MESSPCSKVTFAKGPTQGPLLKTAVPRFIIFCNIYVNIRLFLAYHIQYRLHLHRDFFSFIYC